MKRIVLLLIALLAVGCSKSEEKQEDFSQYKLNVPEWLVGRWEYKEYLIDYSFEFTKDDYRVFKNSYFEARQSRLVEQKEYSFKFKEDNVHTYYFIEFLPNNGEYYKHYYEWTEWSAPSSFFENKQSFKIVYTQVDKYGSDIKVISERKDWYKKVK